MTDLIVAQNNLPASIEDLSKFVLVGRDKLQAVRAEMSALNNLNLTKEVREQKLREGQEIGKLVLLAEARLGELFNQMPKQQGTRTDLQPLPPTGKKLDDRSEVDKPKPKLEVAAEMGFNKNQVAQFQKLADNPDAVQSAIAKARDNGDVVSQAQILNEIKQTKRKEEIQKQAEEIEQRAIEQPDGLFNVIVIDPPWGYVKQAHHGSYDANGRRGTCPYPEMTQDELKTIEPRSAMWYFYRQVSLTTNISLL